MFNNLGQLLNSEINVRLKIVASGCDQCVWLLGVVIGRALKGVISIQCVLKA